MASSHELMALRKALDNLASRSLLIDANDKASLEAFIGGCHDIDAVAHAVGVQPFLSLLSLFHTYLDTAYTQAPERCLEIISYGISVLQTAIAYGDGSTLTDTDVAHHKKTFESLLGACSSAPENEASFSDDRAAFYSSLHLYIEELESTILALEKNPQETECIDAAFRIVHTIKGEAALVGEKSIQLLTHEAESVLEPHRKQHIPISTNVCSWVFQVIDLLKEMNQNHTSHEHPEWETRIALLIKDKPLVSGKTASEHTPHDDYTPRVPVLDLSEGAEILYEFISESEDHLVVAEEALLGLEQEPNNAELINKIFRGFHTIKGASGFLNFEDMKALTHDTETMMDHVRKGMRVLDKIVVDTVLESIDVTRKLLGLLKEQAHNQGALLSEYYSIAPLLGRIRMLNREIAGEQPPKPKQKIGEILVNQGVITTADLSDALTVQEIEPDKKIGEVLVAQGSATAKQVERGLEMQQKGSDQTIKIAVGKLDSLIDSVGELVISGTQVAQDTTIQKMDNRILLQNVAQLQRIIREVQDTAMGMRLVPIKPLFQKMQRLVRDLSHKAQKQVDIRLNGEDTEIDKNIVDLLSDPLMHMVRNSVDHGIEAKDIRIARNKPEVGVVELSAYHQGGNIVVEIRDDGGGLSKEKIVKKARERGLLKENDSWPDNRIYNLIFEAGFSTAEKITDISGRGVGMDVVRRNIEQLRGKIDISTDEGKGSCFAIKLPLTLAIIDGIVVRVGRERYIAPIMSVVEFIQPDDADVTCIADKGEMIKIHDTLYQVIRLDEFMGHQNKGRDRASYTGCLVESDNGRACLFVDELLGQQQVVIKNLGDTFREVRGVSGGTILGDGRVGLILDINGIIAQARA